MKATFVPTDKTDECTMFGMVFPRGEAVDVSSLAPAQLAKLEGNSHFEVSGGEAPKRRGRPPKVQEPEADAINDLTDSDDGADAQGD